MSQIPCKCIDFNKNKGDPKCPICKGKGILEPNKRKRISLEERINKKDQMNAQLKER